jgi:hypothetical protein
MKVRRKHFGFPNNRDASDIEAIPLDDGDDERLLALSGMLHLAVMAHAQEEARVAHRHLEWEREPAQGPDRLQARGESHRSSVLPDFRFERSAISDAGSTSFDGQRIRRNEQN